MNFYPSNTRPLDIWMKSLFQLKINKR
jgi:hypothetical protein